MRFINSNKDFYQNPELQSRISERLANLFEPVSRIDRLLYGVIRELMEHYVVPYFTDVITRHTEVEFHQKIEEGFDLVEDMRINHPNIFNPFMKITKKFKKRLIFNEIVMLDMIIDIVQSYPYYWNITPDERSKLYNMILNLKMEIYS